MAKKSVQSAHWLDGEYICITCSFELDYHTPTQACAVCGTKPTAAQTNYANERCQCVLLSVDGKTTGLLVNPHCRRHQPGPH